MEKKTIWLENIKFDKPKKLGKNIEVDILIIGGGITGLSTAYHLINSNKSVCLVERNKIANGISSRTTGKITYLQDNIYTKLKDKAYQYYCSQKDAIKLVENIIIKNNISCDFKKVKSYLFTDLESKISKIKKEEQILKEMNVHYNIENELPNDIKVKYAISVSDTAIFHPIKYLLSLSKIITKNGINIYENSNVTSIKKEDDYYICMVNKNTIKASKVIIASHYPFFLYPYFLPLKTYLEKSYISATKVDKVYDYSAITVSKPVKSIRFHQDNYFIYLNGTHNMCNNYNNKESFSNLIIDLSKMNLEPDYIWSNYDIMTEDNLPYIGYIDSNLLIGTGYNTWGMTNGSIAGKILSDLVLNNSNKYKNLFDPKRKKKLNILKYPVFMTYSAKSFIANKINKNKSWYNDSVKFITKNGEKLAIYIDSDGISHVVYNLCPHMKCSLIFNEVEKTWDCPCHGSRFDIDGNPIFGPSNYNIKYKK